MNNFELVVTIDGVATSPGPRELKEKTGLRNPFTIATQDKDTHEILEETYTIESDNPSVAEAIRHRTSSGGTIFSHLVLPNGPGRATITIRGDESGAEYELEISVTGDVSISGLTTGSGDWLEDDTIRVNGSGTLEVDLRTWNRDIPIYWSSSDPSILVVSGDGVAPDLEPHQETVGRASVRADRPGKVTVTATLSNGQEERIQIEVIEDRLNIVGPTEVAVNDSIVLEVSSTHPDDQYFQWRFPDPQTVADLEMLDSAGKRVRVTGLDVGRTKLVVVAPMSQLEREIELTVVSNIEDGIKLEASTLVISPKESLSVTAETRQGGEVVHESYTWTSSNPDVVVVEDPNGPKTTVRGVSGGKATLTARGDESGLEGSLVLSVTGVEIDGPAFIEPGGDGNYEAKTSVGPNPFFEWTIDPPRGVVRQVPNAGRNTLHGLAEGAVELTATVDGGIFGSKLVAVTEQPIMLLFYKPDPKNPEHPPVGPANTVIGRRDRPKVYLFATGKVKPGKYTLEIGIFGATVKPQYVVSDGSGVKFEGDFTPIPFSTSFEIDGPIHELFQLPTIPDDWRSPIVVVVTLKLGGEPVVQDEIEVRLR